MRSICSLFIAVLFFVFSAGVFADINTGTQPGMSTNPTVPASNAPCMGERTPATPHYSELDEAHACLIKDVSNWWGDNANTDIMNSIEGVTYDQITTSQIPTTDFSQYDFVVIEGNQDMTFNTNFNNYISYLEDYVNGGGWLQVHLATNTHDPELILWDGTTVVDPYNYQTQNYMGPDGEGHPILEGVTEPYEGNYANHGFVGNYPEDASVIVVSADQQATLIEYGYGQGNVIAFTMPLEYSYANGYNSAQILVNTMNYCANRPPAGPVQIEIIPDNPPVTVPQGGTVGFSVHITSTYPPTVQAWFWTTIQLPNGQQFGPLAQAQLNVSNGMDLWVTNLSQDIPIIAPLGQYRYYLSAGLNLGHPLLQDDFRFTVIAAANQAGGSSDWDVTGFDRIAASGEAQLMSLPSRFAMAEVYPNPFNPTANISLALPEATDLSVTVFNVMGQQVATLARGQHSAGTHNFVFDGSNLSSGIYFVRAATGNGDSALQRIVLMK